MEKYLEDCTFKKNAEVVINSLLTIKIQETENKLLRKIIYAFN